MMYHKWDELILRTRETVEQKLIDWFNSAPSCEVNRAARYAVLGGGHRWRSLFAVAISELFDPPPDVFETVMSGAVAIELIHAASLVLDDLPSMDNAAMRRGKTCTHLVFPEWVLDMLPVFLVTGAYELFLHGEGPFPERRLKACRELSRTGLRMINGQEKDLAQVPEQYSDEDLIECYRLKTGALWSTAGQAVAIICGADSADTKKMSDCGMNMALYYQFLDDVGDATGTVATIGKTSGLDKNKLTSVTIYGVAEAKQRAKSFQKKALDYIDEYGAQADFLRHLIHRASYVLE